MDAKIRDEFNKAFEETRKLVEASKKQSIKERTEAEVTHFLLAPTLTNILGWKPFEDIYCQFSGEKGSVFDFLLLDNKDKQFRCNIEAKKHAVINKGDILLDEATKRLNTTDSTEEYCVITDFYDWYFYHKDFKDEKGELTPFLTANLWDISEFEFAKIFFTLGPGVTRIKKGLSSFLDEVTKVKDGTFSPKVLGDERVSYKPLFGNTYALAKRFGVELLDRFSSRDNPQFFDDLNSVKNGVDIKAGVSIESTNNAPYPVQFKITDDGGVKLKDITLSEDKAELTSEELVRLYEIYQRGESFPSIKSFLQELGGGKSFLKKHWKIGGKSLKSLGM